MLSCSATFSLAILILCAATAHCAWPVRQRQEQLLVTSSKDTSGVVRLLTKESIFAPTVPAADAEQTQVASIVEDWSLVCKELCGAGSGAVSCAFECTADEKANAASYGKTLPMLETFLPMQNDLICKEICAIQLGDSRCQCESAKVAAYATQSVINSDTRLVCSTFCANSENTLTLQGCRACPLVAKHNLRPISAADGAGGGQAQALIRGHVVQQKRDVSHAPKSDDGVSTTTPDWNELCESLCKTGDGGSLCNCDLSPFMYTK